MKKLFTLSMLAVAAMAAFSCTVELESIQPEEQVFEPKVIKAYTDDDVTADTKTSLSGVSILWADTDHIKGWDGTDVHTSTATAVSGENKIATFTFATVTVADDLFYLAYPAEKVSNMDDDFAYATLPSAQAATVDSFANQANVAVADGMTDNPIFKNVGGLISFTINNDNITSVTLSADEDLTGDSKISLAALTFAQPTITNGKNYVTVSGTIANGSTYYAVVYPGTYHNLKIEVRNTAGQVATYTNPNALIVARNSNLHIATLTIPDEGKWNTPTKGSEYTWTLATNDIGSPDTQQNPTTMLSSFSKGTPSLAWNAEYDFSSNDYLGGVSEKGQQVGSGSNPCTSYVLKTTGYTEYVKDIRVNFSHASSGSASVSIKVGDIYLKNGVNTSVTATTTATDYIFTYDMLLKGDIEISFANSASKAFYIKSIEINPDTRTPQTLTFAETSCSVELAEGTFASPSLSGNNTPVTYSSDDTDIATVNPSTGVVTLKTTGVVNITATAAANETYKEGSTSYELTINPGPSAISEVIAASSGDTVYTEGVVAQVNKKGFVLTDGTDNIFVYQNAVPSVVAGQSVKVRGTRGVNNGIPQISGTPTIIAGATGQAITRTSVTNITSANATGHTYSTYASLTGTITIDGTYVNVSIAGSSTKGSLYQLNGDEVFSAGTIAALEGESATVTGYIVGSTSSYLALAVVDINVDPAVAFIATDPKNGSTIEWADDESGVSKTETIRVFLNVDATGYDVSYTDTGSLWTVSDNTTGTITVYPKNDNESTTEDKTLTLTISNKDDGSVKSVITLKQNKVPAPATVLVEESFDNGNSGIDSKLTLTNATGSQKNFARLGSGSNKGKISCAIPSASASGKTLTITFDANRWSASEKTLSITVSNGTASISSVNLENTMSGSTSSPAWNSTCDKISFTVTPDSGKDVTINIEGNKRFLLDNFKVIAQ